MVTMSEDMQLRRDVEAELDWDPRFDSRRIGVSVKGGVVALSGQVGSYAESRAAQEAVQSVVGVQAVANDIVVDLPQASKLSDADLAEAAVTILKHHASVSCSEVKLVVREGWITLEGQVDQWFQRNAVEAALSSLRGVKGISNNIAIRRQAAQNDVQARIQEAFRRRALTDAKQISVRIVEGTVTLEGRVRSWQERQQVENAAWQSPGVSQVIDKLTISP